MKKRYGLYLVLLFGVVLFFGSGCFDDEDLEDKVTIFNSTDETGELLVEKRIGKGETLVIERPEIEEED